MKFLRKSKLILLFLTILIVNCKNQNNSENEIEYNLDDFKVNINPPKTFFKADKNYSNKVKEDGEKLFKEHLNIELNNEGFFFFFKKGEFSELKARKYKLEENIKNNYEENWRKLNAITYNLIMKTVSRSLENSTFDTISRIEYINGQKFFVFEINNKMKDLNNNDTNFKILKYSNQ